MHDLARIILEQLCSNGDLVQILLILHELAVGFAYIYAFRHHEDGCNDAGGQNLIRTAAAKDVLCDLDGIVRLRAAQREDRWVLIALQGLIQRRDLPVHENPGIARQHLGEADHGTVRTMGNGKSIVYEEIE